MHGAVSGLIKPQGATSPASSQGVKYDPPSMILLRKPKCLNLLLDVIFADTLNMQVPSRQSVLNCLPAALIVAVQFAGGWYAFAEEPAIPNAPGPALSAGTGILVSSLGQILTNNHVVGGCRNILVGLAGGYAAEATLLYVDVANDLALIKVDRKISEENVAKVRVSPPVRSGETIAAFGFPLPDVLSQEGNITGGNISALAGPGDDVRFYQFTAPIQPGNSGGPLLDEAGNVVGIVQSMLGETGGEFPQNVNFAIKSSVVVSFLQAHDIAFQNAVTGERQKLPEIADMARRFAVLIVCASDQPQTSPPSPDPNSAQRLQEFDQRDQESARHDPPLTSPLRALYRAYVDLTEEDRASAGSLAPRIASFAAEVEESKNRLAAFATNVDDVASEEAHRAYDKLTLFDKILYQVMASDEVFVKVCEAEGSLALQTQRELRLCRDPSMIVVVNGVWGQRSVASARQFIDDAKYWEWTDADIDLTVPSLQLRDLVHRVRTEGYGPICTQAGANAPLPKVNVAELCRQRLSSRR